VLVELLDFLLPKVRMVITQFSLQSHQQAVAAVLAQLQTKMEILAVPVVVVQKMAALVVLALLIKVSKVEIPQTTLMVQVAVVLE
jgi:hypothetical protein